jgi:hypothetical protein
MDTWETIRLRCRRDGEKIKPVARDLGLAPNTVRKYLRQDGAPKRTARPRARRLDRYVMHIDELIQHMFAAKLIRNHAAGVDDECNRGVPSAEGPPNGYRGRFGKEKSPCYRAFNGCADRI